VLTPQPHNHDKDCRVSTMIDKHSPRALLSCAGPRVQHDGVMLPNGKVILINGGEVSGCC
jgi:hypothetical protein